MLLHHGVVEVFSLLSSGLGNVFISDHCVVSVFCYFSLFFGKREGNDSFLKSCYGFVKGNITLNFAADEDPSASQSCSNNLRAIPGTIHLLPHVVCPVRAFSDPTAEVVTCLLALGMPRPLCFHFPPLPWTRLTVLLWLLASYRHVDISCLGLCAKMCSPNLSLYLRISNKVKLNSKMIEKPLFLSLRGWSKRGKR